MSTSKDKTPTFTSKAKRRETLVEENFLQPQPVLSKKKANSDIRSNYCLFDDEDDLTTMGRNLSENTTSQKSAGSPNPVAGNS